MPPLASRCLPRQRGFPDGVGDLFMGEIAVRPEGPPPMSDVAAGLEVVNRAGNKVIWLVGPEHVQVPDFSTRAASAEGAQGSILRQLAGHEFHLPSHARTQRVETPERMVECGACREDGPGHS